MTIDRIRTAEFSAVAGAGYLNAASIGPLPERARLAMEAVGDLRARPQSMTDEDFVAPARRARELCARLIHADPAEIVLAPSTSFGINLAALGLRVPPGSTVLVPEREFPANVYPWMRRPNLALERTPVDRDGWPDIPRLLERLGDPRVAILSLSSVQFDNGYRPDLDLIGARCRETDTLFVVDAVQSLGCVPLDVARTPADIVAAGAHKWLCGPLGAGFAYVRRDVQERLDPTSIGWFAMTASQDVSHVIDYDWNLVPDARRYEVGSPPLQDHAGLAASLEVLLDTGVERIADHLDSLLRPLFEWAADVPEAHCATPTDPNRRAGIFTLRPPDPAATDQALRKAGVVCSIREGGVRIAPHVYNTEAEIARALDVLEGERRRGWR